MTIRSRGGLAAEAQKKITRQVRELRVGGRLNSIIYSCFLSIIINTSHSSLFHSQNYLVLENKLHVTFLQMI